jgi:hypothetical protein
MECDKGLMPPQFGEIKKITTSCQREKECEKKEKP